MSTGRPRDNARKRAVEANSGSGVGALLKPSRGYRDDLARQGITPTNHAAINRQKLKETQQRVRNQKTEDEEKKNQKAFKMKRFENAEPRVRQAAAAKASDNTHSFLKKNTAEKENKPEPVARPQRVKVKAALPTAEELARVPAPPVSNTNYVAANTSNAVRSKPPQRQSDEDSSSAHDRGKVPEYLIERKNELAAAAEAKRVEEENKQIPPGMVKMSEEERLRTLDVLEQNRQQLERELSQFPLTVETISKRKAKEAIEAKLVEIENAKKVFSKPNVFVRQNA